MGEIVKYLIIMASYYFGRSGEEMTYEEFIELFKSRAQSELSYDPALIEFYKEGYSSEDPKVLEWIIDTNKRFCGKDSIWLLKDFLVLKEDAGNGVFVAQRVAIHDVYMDAEKDGFDSAFEGVRKAHEEITRAKAGDVISKRVSGSYEAIREQLIVRPLNYGLHIDELGGNVYRKVGDFVLALYQLIGDSAVSVISSKISRDELASWGMSNRADEVIDEALANTSRLFPACVYDGRGGATNEEMTANFLEGEFERKDITADWRTILLSTFRTTNGAASLFYPGVAEKMMRIMGGAFWAVFMNINDVMIFERGDKLAEKCARMAKTGGGLGEMLSGRVYLCSEKGINPV